MTLADGARIALIAECAEFDPLARIALPVRDPVLIGRVHHHVALILRALGRSIGAKPLDHAAASSRCVRQQRLAASALSNVPRSCVFSPGAGTSRRLSKRNRAPSRTARTM